MKKIIFAAAALSLLLALSLPLCAEDADAEETLHTFRADLLQEGSLLPEPAEGPLLLKAAGDASVLEELDRRLYDAFLNRDDKVDIGDLNLNVDDFDDNEYYGAVINNHPDCFYVSGMYSCVSSGGIIRTLRIFYLNEYDDTHIEALNDMTDRIVSGVDPAWGDERKALYLHDWLVTHCKYDLSYSKYTAYDAVIGGESVCQGYALAYQILCAKVGMKVGYVSSSQINHAWNVVKIDGFDYYIDCTWDDPIMSSDSASGPACEYYCSHEFFMLSEKAMFDKEHETNDWIISAGYDKSGTSDKYDEAYWTNVSTAVLLAGSKAYYSGGSNPDNKKLMSYDYDSGAAEVICEFETNKYYISKSKGRYSYGFGICSAVYGEDLIAATADSIYRVHPDGGYEKLYSLFDEEDYESGGIMGFRIEGNVCSYDVYKNKLESDFLRTDTLDLSSFAPAVLPGDVDSDGEAATPLDSMTLARYLAGWAGYGDISFAASDIDEDGEVTLKDAIILARWIAGWEIYAGYFEP